MARTKKRPTMQDEADLGTLRGWAEAIAGAERERAVLIWRLRDSGVSPDDISDAARLPISTLYKVERP